MRPLTSPTEAAARALAWQYIKDFVSTDNPDPGNFPPYIYFRLTSWVVKQRQDGLYTIYQAYITTFKAWSTIRKEHTPKATPAQFRNIGQRLSQFARRLSKEVIKNVTITY